VVRRPDVLHGRQYGEGNISRRHGGAEGGRWRRIVVRGGEVMEDEGVVRATRSARWE